MLACVNHLPESGWCWYSQDLWGVRESYGFLLMIEWDVSSAETVGIKFIRLAALPSKYFPFTTLLEERGCCTPMAVLPALSIFSKTPIRNAKLDA